MAGISVVTCILAILIDNRQVVAATSCIFGDGCEYPCNCVNDTVCNRATGACPNGCREGQPRPAGYETVFDWRGPGCRIGNVAFHKPVSQNGTYMQWFANQSVDGKLPENVGEESTTCSHTNTDGESWWRVDLMGNFRIYNITIFNRLQAYSAQRTASLDIYVSNGTDDKNTLCSSFLGPLDAGGNVTISCSTPFVGRYVRLQRTGGFDVSITNICEVVVIGYEVVTVDCNRCSSTCDDIVGCLECSGYKPPSCEAQCDAGHYGINCESSCSDRHCKGDNKTCYHVTGNCTDGCQDWFVGDQCITNISEPTLSNSTSISAAALNSSNVRVIWIQDDDVHANLSQYYGYQVQYKTNSDSRFLPGSNISHVPGKVQYSDVIGDLLSNTWYMLRVNGYRQQDDLFELSIWPTSEVMVKTLCNAPGPVIIFNLTTTASIDKTFSIDVEWQSPSTGCDSISSIQILFRLNGNKEWKTNDVINPETSTSLSITVVTEGVWELKLRIVNNEGISSDSNTSIIMLAGGKTGGGSNAGVIAGPVIGGVVVITAVIAVAVFIYRRRVFKGNSEGNQCMTNRQSLTIDKPFAAVEATKKPDVPAKPKPNMASHGAELPLSAQHTVSQHSGMTSAQPTTSSRCTNDIDQGSRNIESANMYSNIELRTDAPMSMSRLKAHMTQLSNALPEVLKAKDGTTGITDGFEREFDDLPGIDINPRTVGSSEANLIKNRFRNIQPFDGTRVILDITEELTCSDYINASYIMGYPRKPCHYIATQGPIKDTVVAFWFMIWQQRANRIVMLTQLIEGGKRKCEQYWPDSDEEKKKKESGPFTIELILSEVHADYAYRKLRLIYKSEEREIHQLHFLAWEDKKCPEDSFPLLAFRGRVLRLPCEETVPVIVHCSAGVGRTGTYIALDYLLNQARCEDQVDVFSCVYHLRTQRMNMVQTADQYRFLYDALLEGSELRVGETGISSDQFDVQYGDMLQEASYSKETTLEEEYQAMCKYKPVILPAANSTSNASKHRSQEVLPVDRYRPRLSTPYAGGNEYINAVYINGFNERKALILTQTPLTETVVDFWRLVYDHDCNCIAMLNAIDNKEATCPRYMPDEDQCSEIYGPFHVELTSTEFALNPCIVSRTLRISKIRRKLVEEPCIVRHFQILGWPSHEEVPPRPNDVIDLLRMMSEWQRKQAKERTVIHCMYGAERSGLLAAACYLLDLLKAEQEVDALTAARYVTSRQPHSFNSVEQYKFLFELAKCYLSGFHTYGNI